jgi:hypothetical protein
MYRKSLDKTFSSKDKGAVIFRSLWRSRWIQMKKCRRIFWVVLAVCFLTVYAIPLAVGSDRPPCGCCSAAPADCIEARPVHACECKFEKTAPAQSAEPFTFGSLFQNWGSECFENACVASFDRPIADRRPHIAFPPEQTRSDFPIYLITLSILC